MLIFKRKTIPKINNKHGVVVSAQEKGWMDSEQMKMWIEKVWRARISGLGRRKSLLVYDSFEAHVTDTVKAPFKRENTELAVIPGGLTSLLQPQELICSWIWQAWNAIPSEMIAASFLKCGITQFGWIRR